MKQTMFDHRLERHIDELRWLYMELYNNGAMFAELCDKLREFYDQRSALLKKRDLEREANPEWYKSNDLIGMMLYIDNGVVVVPNVVLGNQHRTDAALFLLETR